MADIRTEIDRIAHISFDRYKRSKASDGHTITIKLKYGDFRQITRSKTLEQRINEEVPFVDLALSLMTEDLLNDDGIRLIGVGISNFRKDEEPQKPSQLTLEF